MSAVKILRDDPCSPDFKPLEEALHAWEIRRSDPKESHRRAKRLLEYALEIDQPLVTAWAYLTCGAHELAGNELDEAQDSLSSAQSLFKRVQEQRGESLSVILSARIQFARGNFHSALEMYKSIIEREAHGLQTLERFEAFNAIAGCFWGLDNVELSLLYLSKAFETLRNTPFNAERAAVLNNMGAALLAVGNYEAGRDFLTAASRFVEGATDKTLELNILSNLTACHVELKEVALAVSVSKRMLTDFQEIVFAGPTNTALCNAAMAFALGKHFSLADQCLVGAQIITEEHDLPIQRIQLAQAEAAINESRGNYAIAATQAESLLERFKEHMSNEVRSQLLGLLASCYHRLSRLNDLIEIKKKRLQLSESRYQSGLAAAMVILDIKSQLTRLTTEVFAARTKGRKSGPLFIPDSTATKPRSHRS
jgi:tetratricopeptide (TPR) repeat protein